MVQTMCSKTSRTMVRAPQHDTHLFEGSFDIIIKFKPLI